VAELVDAERNIGNTLITGSNPVLTTEGVNPETLKDKVDDSWKDSNIVRWRNWITAWTVREDNINPCL
jgi:hypothetical protein